jgi:hypothetical protein
MLTISRRRLLLECSRCAQAKLIDVAIADDGRLGIAKCDACKTDELRVASVMRPRRRRPVRPVEPTVADEPVDSEFIAAGEVRLRVRLALGELRIAS